jgi:hypothetical protein
MNIKEKIKEKLKEIWNHMPSVLINLISEYDRHSFLDRLNNLRGFDSEKLFIYKHLFDDIHSPKIHVSFSSKNLNEDDNVYKIPICNLSINDHNKRDFLSNSYIMVGNDSGTSTFVELDFGYRYMNWYDVMYRWTVKNIKLEVPQTSQSRQLVNVRESYLNDELFITWSSYKNQCFFIDKIELNSNGYIVDNIIEEYIKTSNFQSFIKHSLFSKQKDLLISELKLIFTH